MMPVTQCPRCGRPHSGICGIPGMGVRIATGAGSRPIRRRSSMTDSYSIDAKPAKAKPKRWLTKHGLEELLDWGLEQERKCKEMLKALPSEMEEYQTILERLDKAMEVNEQIRKQIAVKRQK